MSTTDHPTVTVHVHHRDGHVWVDSPDMPGWTATAATVDGAYVAARKAVDWYARHYTIVYTEAP